MHLGVFHRGVASNLTAAAGRGIALPGGKSGTGVRRDEMSRDGEGLATATARDGGIAGWAWVVL